MSKKLDMRPSRSDTAGTPTLRSLDLTGRDRQLRSALQVMGRVAARFARSARKTLPFIVRRRTRLVPEPVTIADVVASPEPQSTTLFEVHLAEEGGPAWAKLRLDGGAIALVLEGALGGGEGELASLERELTLAQRVLVGRLARGLADDFAAAVTSEAAVDLKIVSLQSVPAGESIEPCTSDALRVDTVFEGLEGAKVSLLMSAEALQAATKEQAEEEPAHGDPRMLDALQEVPVEVVAELGRTTLGLRSVLGLRPGQVLRLHTAVDDPVSIRVGGMKKLYGVPVVSRGQLSISIRGRHGGSGS